MSKKTYRVRNWKEYNKALVQRGSITFWFNEKTIKKWEVSASKNFTQRGRPRKYSNLAIETCVVLKSLFHLSYRQCQGFVKSLCAQLGFKINCPSYSQICRRQKSLTIKLKHHVRGPIHVVVDGTGLKIFGEGEWKVRQHGVSKSRTWKKLHVGIDVASKAFVMMELTEKRVAESKQFKALLNQYEGRLMKVGGDKGYDSYSCHEEVAKRGGISAISIQRKAKIRQRKNKTIKPLVRDNIIRRMRKIGRRKWKEEVDYHKRSLVENGFYRYKTIFGSKLHSICIENQKIEALVCCNILNKFIQLGMPMSKAI